jgi:hypothetical protein
VQVYTIAIRRRRVGVGFQNCGTVLSQDLAVATPTLVAIRRETEGAPSGSASFMARGRVATVAPGRRRRRPRGVGC